MDWNEILNVSVFGNTVYAYLFSLCIFVLVWVVIFIIKRVVLAWLAAIAKRTKTTLDDKIIEYVQSINIFFYIIVSVYISLSLLKLPDIIQKASFYALILAILYYAVKFVHKLIEYFLLKVEEEQRKMYKEVDLSQLNLASDFLKAVVWLIAILLLFSNLGIDITALLTGLGIAGIAVAFAMQNILADIFASFSIYFDKPFRKGDFIVVGNESGTIKKIGLKTTRIESLSGEEIVISNRQLVDSIVHNYKRMDYRRVKFRFGVTYDTDVKKLEKIPAYVKEIIEKIEKDGKKIATLDRVHFFNFGDSALEYEVMYTVHSSDYKTYMDVQQEINLKLIKKFKKEGIEFAYPTQTIYLKREN
jgi:small-conductance mechanosensitive channel